MPVYVVAYDLRADDDPAQYEAVAAVLEKMGQAVRVQKSVWLIAVDLTERRIISALKDVCDENDRLLVVLAGAKPWRHRAMQGTREFVDAHF